MGGNWDPLGDLQDAVGDAYDTFVDPVVDEAEEAVNTGMTLIEEVGEVVGGVVGDALEAIGLDPDQLAAEWADLTDEALQAVLDFLNSVAELTATLVSTESLAAQAQATFNLPLQEKMSAPIMSLFVSLKSAIQAVLGAVNVVLNALREVNNLLPGLGIEDAVNNVDPRFADWLQGAGLPRL